MKQPIEINGLKLEINIEEQGKGDQTLLMVHGIPTNARLMETCPRSLKR